MYGIYFVDFLAHSEPGSIVPVPEILKQVPEITDECFLSSQAVGTRDSLAWLRERQVLVVPPLPLIGINSDIIRITDICRILYLF